jgi:hypothetical protein
MPNTMIEAHGWRLKGKAGTKQPSLTSKWSRRMRTHTLNRYTITLLDQRMDKLNRIRSTFRARRSVCSINVRISSGEQNYHTTPMLRRSRSGVLTRITPQAKKERTKSPNIDQLRVHHSSYLIRFVPLPVKRFMRAFSRTLRRKKLRLRHSRKAYRPSYPQNDCCCEIHGRRTHPNP